MPNWFGRRNRKKLISSQKSRLVLRAAFFVSKKGTMVKLYRYDREKGEWVFFDYGVKSRAREYNLQGYMVAHFW